MNNVIVDLASGGGSMADKFDDTHLRSPRLEFGASWTSGSNPVAGQTYRFIYHPSMEASDDIKFTRVDDGTDYGTLT